MTRLKSEQIACLAGIGEAMADITRPRLIQYPRLQMWDLHRISQQTRHMINRIAVPAGDVERVTGCERVFHRQTKRPRDIAHVYEVPLLLTVFENQRLLPVQQARAEIS